MYSDIAANKRKTVLIMAVFIGFVAAIIWVLNAAYFGGSHAVFYGGVIGAALYTLFTYYSGAKMALAVNGAREISKRDNPRLYRMVENMAITQGLPMPKVYIMDDPAANAFATGRDPRHSAVCATTGILDLLNDTELEGVIGHEMGHIKNYDIRVSMVAFALTAVISLIADFILHWAWFGGNKDRENNNAALMVLGIVAALIAPLIASMIQMAISRQREYLADATGALATRYPEGLANALEKIGGVSTATRRQNSATAHLFFANPLRGGKIAGLFSTHPPIEERVARLRNMGGRA